MGTAVHSLSHQNSDEVSTAPKTVWLGSDITLIHVRSVGARQRRHTDTHGQSNTQHAEVRGNEGEKQRGGQGEIRKNMTVLYVSVSLARTVRVITDTE